MNVKDRQIISQICELERGRGWMHRKCKISAYDDVTIDKMDITRQTVDYSDLRANHLWLL